VDVVVVERMRVFMAMPGDFIMSGMYLLMFEVRRSCGALGLQGSVFSFLWGNFSSVRSVLIVDWMSSSSTDATLYLKQESFYFKNL
jgi:hypothetical protein